MNEDDSGLPESSFAILSTMQALSILNVILIKN